MKVKLILVIVIISLFTILSLVGMIYGIISHGKISGGTTLVKNLTNNHLREPVFSVEVNNCPQFDNINQAVFPGTKSVCYCYNFFQSYLKKFSSCSSKYDRGCFTSYGLSSQFLSQWKGKTICAKRITGMNYYELLRNGNVKPDCLSTEKSCGLIDSLNNKLCLRPDQECPLNVLTSALINPTNKKFIPFGDNSNLYYGNDDKNGNVVVEFQTTELEQVCINPNETHGEDPYFNGGTIYYNVDKVRTCTGIDGIQNNHFYEIVDSANKFDIYNSNGVLNTINGKYTDLAASNSAQLKNQKIYINRRNYSGWKTSCVQNQNTHPTFLLQMTQQYEGNASKALGTMVLGIILFIFAICSICCVLASAKNEESAQSYTKVIGVVYFILSLPAAILMFYIKELNLSNDIINCSDEINNRLLALSQTTTTGVTLYTDILLGIYFTLICFVLLKFAVLYFMSGPLSDEDQTQFDYQNQDELKSQQGSNFNQNLPQQQQNQVNVNDTNFNNNFS